MSIFDPINRTFGGFNQRVSGLGLPGGLGLLQAGTDILGGQPIGQAVRGGLQTFQDVTQLDEERKRKALVQKLVSEGGFTQEEQALILASQNPASVAAQIRAQNAAAARPQSNIGQLASDLQKGIISQEDFDAAMAKATYTKPVIPQYTTFDNNLYEKTSSGLKLVRKGTPDLKYTEFDGDLYQETPDGLKLIQKGTTDPKFLTFDNKLFKQTATGLELIEQGTKDTKFITLNDKVYRQDGNNLVEVLDDTKPSFREFDGDLYESTADGLKLVQKGTKDSKFITVNGKVFRQDGNDLVEVLDESQPKAANLVNLIATKDFNLNGQSIKKGQVFTLDKNSQTDLINQATSLQTGGAIIAPSKVENITGGADTVDQPPAISPVSPIDIEQAAGGDIAGFAKDFFNFVGGVTMIGEPATARRDEQTNIAALENAVLPGLVRSISSTGAVRTQEAAKKLIPSTRDSDNKMSSKVNALIPVLQQKLQEADNVLKSPGKITASQRTLALQITSTYPQIISALELSRDRYEERNAKSDIQKKADKILEELK
jgi:hypothetical protein